MNILFSNNNKFINSYNIKFFNKIISYILNFNKIYLINIKIVNIYEIKKLNLYFNNINKSTNSLTFIKKIKINNYINNIIDIAICRKILEKESKKYNIKLFFHITHIIIHSCLHIIGFNHKNYNEFNLMIKKEEKIFKKFNIPNPHK